MRSQEDLVREFVGTSSDEDSKRSEYTRQRLLFEVLLDIRALLNEDKKK